MSALSAQTCEACNASATRLTLGEIQLLLPEVSGWEIICESDIQKLSRTFKTKNYAESMSFTNAVAELAESANHHPLLIVEYSSVTVLWWSHKIEGLHKNDFIMAAKTSALF
jgi:4a-hydroxytetrahydrobiopterin dehydratase